MWLALVSNVMSLNGVLFDSKFLFFGGTSKSVSRNNAFDALQIGQSWRLFAPMPVHAQHHYQIRAELTDGSIVDLMSRMPVPIVRSNPDGYAISFVSHRWLKFFSRFDDLSPQQWSALGLYFCRKAAEWDAGLRGRSAPSRSRSSSRRSTSDGARIWRRRSNAPCPAMSRTGDAAVLPVARLPRLSNT